MLRPRRIPIAIVLVCALAASAALAAGALSGGRIGPALHLTGNGRHLQPAGRMVTLGHFPTGGALTPDGRFYWTVSTGRGLNDIRIVSVAKRRVVQILPLPGGSGGVAIDPNRPVAYVSGLPDSDASQADQQRPNVPGRGGDVIHVFSYNARSGRATETGTIPVPPPSSAPLPQDFPPTNFKRIAWPDRLAITPTGDRLLVPLNLADAAAVVDLKHRHVAYVPTGPYPYGAAVLPDGRTGLVSNEGPGTLSVIDIVHNRRLRDIRVGPPLSHPEGIVVAPGGDRASVAIANDDEVAVVDVRRMAVERMLSVERPQGGGESPVAVALNASGSRLYVAEASADEVAVFTAPGGRLLGRIPTAAYPADVQVVPRRGHRGTLVWLAAKGFGAGANPNGPNPLQVSDANLLQHPGTAVLSNGRAGFLTVPTDAQLRADTRAANRQVVPSNPEPAPAGTPLRAGGPIRHVFYIVRENRTYDQVLGDDTRGDGDPQLTLFGNQVTPNFHALVNRFPLLDHFYANSEASIDGHFWTSAAAVSDYVHKNWQQNYAHRRRPYDFGVYSITWPGNGFLFDQAQKQGISYFNYGEAIAGVVPLTDKDRTVAQTTEVALKLSNSDIGPPVGCYPNDASIGADAITKRDTYDSSLPAGAAIGSESRFSCFQTRFLLQQLTNSVPAFTYMVLPSDHTEGTKPGRRSPRAMVAENDYALGQIVDLISHSSIWSSSAIFVLEDDSQDGADHVDAHRMPAGVFSPYARPGAVVHTRYDMLSMIRSIELILGMHPLGFADAVATPMYDAFQSTPASTAPFSVIAPTYPLEQKNAATAANARLSASYGLANHPDTIPQRLLDRILWQSVHGPHSQPPPPGPNADAGE